MALYVGKGVTGANGNSFNVYGYPIPNDLSSIFANSNITSPMTIANSTSSFNISSLGENHEVPVVLYTATGLMITSGVSFSFSWYRKRDSKLVFQFSASTPGPPNGQYYSGYSVCAWIGWLSDTNNGVGSYPQYREIQENGDYYCRFIASGGLSVDDSVNFSITGIPAKTVVENVTASTFDWTVRLSSYFTTSNYIRAGVCSQPFTDGQTTQPNGIISQVYATASSSGCAASGTGSINGANAAFGFVQAANGLYYKVGNQAAAFKPENWIWRSYIQRGQPVNISASEWNDFTAQINKFRSYQGKGSLGFTQAPYADGKFYSFMFNQVLTAIRGGTLDGTYYPPLDMPVYYTLPSNRVNGDTINASYFFNMSLSMNSIT